MANLFSDPNQSLPDILQADLQELLTWDNNAYLTWVSLAEDDGGADGSRWFTVKLTSDGIRFGLRLEFRIPEWMNARGVAALLPASLEVADCRPGDRAAVDLGLKRWSELTAAVPKVARTCARLLNELWGRTDSDEVLLMTIDYQDQQLELPFSELPTYGK